MDNGYGNVASSIVWDSIRLSDPFGVYNAGTASSIDITTVDFVDRHHGVFGGNFNTFPTNARYAMLVDDQSDYYSTRFWYDKLGRMVLSQNTKQFNKSPQAYSYTKYDALGRIAEVGEKFENTSGTKFRNVFGDYVNALFNVNTINNDSITFWLAGNGSRKEVTHTYYDTVTFNSIPVVQENIRKRVTSVTYEDVDDGIDSTYQNATHYTYDIHGNVNTLLQDNPEISVSGQRYKRIDYEYDLISGKVNKVIYQPDAPDLFIHKYTYDADNRITKVETSNDDILWDVDAKYFYYAHGPLARAEFGKNQVQGVDYAYTLQGWMKGVNSNTLDANRDMGQDGLNDTSNLNRYFAEDATGYTLGYFNGDYKAINGLKWNTVTNRFEAQTTGSDMLTERYQLFNGNISHMGTSIVKTARNADGSAAPQIPLPLSTAYQYDQLNRLKRSEAFNNIDLATNVWLNDGLSPNHLYGNEFSYDANGNILTQSRLDDSANVFDDLTYHYKRDINGHLLQNRLYHVNDSGDPASETDDLEDQGTFDTTYATMNDVNNYRYDEIGNLIADSTEEIDSIAWTVYGKIKEIRRTGGSSKKNLKFDYDASGNRIAKHVLTSANVWENSIYYTRDAQGNVMSTYKQKVVDSAMTFKLNEQHLYGSSRLGMISPYKEMIAADTTNEFAFDTLGKKQYEFSNHLGNVLATVSDRKVALDTNSDNYMDYLLADITSTSDYYPFGAPMNARTFSALPTDVYRNDTTYETVLYENFDPSLTGWLVTDTSVHISYQSGRMRVINSAPWQGTYKEFPTIPGQSYTIEYGMEHGSDYVIVIFTRDSTNVSLLNYLYVYDGDPQPVTFSFTAVDYTSLMHVSKTGGATLDTFYVDSIRIRSDAPTITTVNNNVLAYKYGFGSQEKDDEVSGDGNSNTAEYWQYDSRLGRRWNIDPILAPSVGSYICFENNPILFTDINGDAVGVQGKKEDKDQFVAELDKSLGGFYCAAIDKDNQLTLTKTEQKGEMNASQQAVFDSYNKAITDAMPIDITIDSHTPLLYDDYDLGVLDVTDLQNTTDGPFKTKASILTHFITEQFCLQTTCINDYPTDHKLATEVEYAITGSTTEPKVVAGESKFTITLKMYKGHIIEAPTGVIVNKGEKNGKPGMTVMKVVNGDIIKTKQVFLLDKNTFMNIEKILKGEF